MNRKSLVTLVSILLCASSLVFSSHGWRSAVFVTGLLLMWFKDDL